MSINSVSFNNINNNQNILYHGSNQLIEKPKIIKSHKYKDFGFGVYCTSIDKQAKKWATRLNGRGYLNQYIFNEVIYSELNNLIFNSMTDEWLDFIIHCRRGGTHNYDTVEGPMADDKIFNYINSYLEGDITREAFWVLSKFNYPTHQISFNTQESLKSLTFKEALQCQR